jgi:hypothetical protein
MLIAELLHQLLNTRLLPLFMMVKTALERGR